MVRVMARSHLFAFGLLACSSAAAGRLQQRQLSSTSSVPQPLRTAASTSTASTTTQDVPQALLSIANSLISQNYPSATLAGLRTLSWPTTVVIGTHTYTVEPTTISQTGTSHSTLHTSSSKSHDAVPSETNAKSVAIPNHQTGDKRLAIILGVVLGCLAIAVMGVIFFCLHRRKKDNGSFFLRRSTPSMRSNGSWMPGANRPDTFGTTTYVTTGGAYNAYQPKEPSATVIPRGNTPPIGAHPAYNAFPESSRSTSEENPFYTPDEYQLHSHELDSQAIAQLDHAEPAHRDSSTSLRDSRPPTPFSPLMMMQQMPGPGARPQIHQNPFASPEDDDHREAEDVVSPISPPSKHPERRYSPMVHYPSWDEVSAFSFSGDEREAMGVGQGKGEDGGDGWRRERERRDGRYELA